MKFIILKKVCLMFIVVLLTTTNMNAAHFKETSKMVSIEKNWEERWNKKQQHFKFKLYKLFKKKSNNTKKIKALSYAALSLGIIAALSGLSLFLFPAFLSVTMLMLALVGIIFGTIISWFTLYEIKVNGNIEEYKVYKKLAFIGLVLSLLPILVIFL